MSPLSCLFSWAVQHRAEQGVQHWCGLKLAVVVGASMCSVNDSMRGVNDYWIVSWACQGWGWTLTRGQGGWTLRCQVIVGMAEPRGEKFSARCSCPACSSVPLLCWLPLDTERPAPSWANVLCSFLLFQGAVKCFRAGLGLVFLKKCDKCVPEAQWKWCCM